MAHQHEAPDDTSTQGHAPAESVAADAEALRQEIQLRAYFRYCERGCGPGCELDDWLAAERELLAEKPAPSLTKVSADDRHSRRQGRARR
jgi:hypothetical protein